MSSFEVGRELLVKIMDNYQARLFDSEIVFLQRLSCNPTSHLVNSLKTSLKDGIPGDESDVTARKIAFGSNMKEVSEPPSFCSLFLAALNDFTMKILIVASVLSIAIEVGTAKPEHRNTAWIEGFAILMAVMICASVTAVNDYQKEQQFLKLNTVADSRKKVSLRRNGTLLDIHQDNLLVGDVVMLSEGMEIPADGLLLEANEITTDESAMTGETDPIKKNTYEKCLKISQEIAASCQKNTANKHDVPSPVLMSGTRILTGEGKMLVIVVGSQSCIGKIQALLSNEEPKATPLQMKLQKIARDIGKFGLFSSLIIVLILLIRFGIEKAINPSWNNSIDIPELLNFFIIGITVVVVAIPEGLPLAVTLSLAFSVKKMLNDNNLVRRMEACETMGGANVICSDKTGTLTLNKMTLTCFWNGSRKEFSHSNSSIKLSDYIKPSLYDLFVISSCVNSTALLRPQPKGSSTEQAILKLMDMSAIRYEELREQYPTRMKFPFSSKRKRMSSILAYKEEECIFIKGASEIVLESCDKWLNQDENRIEPIDEALMARIKQEIQLMAEESLRTLCIAYKPIKGESLQAKDDKGVYDAEKHGFVMLALLGVKDIPRPEVPFAIEKCRTAGIKVRMVTGDNIITAKAIAKEVGIIEKNNKFSLVMEGVDFISRIGGVVCKHCQTELCECERDAALAEKNGKNLRIDTIKNMEEFEKIIKDLDVLARSRPEDKYALVTGLLELGNVVAVTGDGTNDAPALKKADVGFAMGINGTEVARSAAAIILLDDNFNSIVKAVMWGRSIYDSIKKFIQFQLTVNIVAVFVTLIGAALIKQQILKPIQMLWINLIMDTFASLALATEPPTQELLNRQPHKRDEYIISKKMFKHILSQAIYQLTIIIILTFLGDQFIPEEADAFDQRIGNRLHLKYRDGIVGGTVRSGRMYFINSGYDYMTIWNELHMYSRHFTVIFNSFVMMQIFNFISSRKLNDQVSILDIQVNVFDGITRNWLFLLIVFLIASLQILLVTFGSIAFGVYPYYGLTIKQWLICIAFGFGSLIVDFLSKFVNQENFKCVEFGNALNDPLDKKKKSSLDLKRHRPSLSRNLSHNHLN